MGPGVPKCAQVGEGDSKLFQAAPGGLRHKINQKTSEIRNSYEIYLPEGVPPHVGPKSEQISHSIIEVCIVLEQPPKPGKS